MSHLLLARTDPFPKTVAILCSGPYRPLLAPKAQVSAAWVFSAVPAATAGLGRSIKGNRCSLDAVTKPKPVGDSAGSAVTQGLAAGGGCPLARGRKASRCQPVGKGLDLRALGRSPRLRQGDHNLLFASYHPRKLSGRGKLFLRASSCTGNSQQQGSESIWLLPVLCFLLICLPPHAEPPCPLLRAVTAARGADLVPLLWCAPVQPQPVEWALGQRRCRLAPLPCCALSPLVSPGEAGVVPTSDAASLVAHVEPVVQRGGMRWLPSVGKPVTNAHKLPGAVPGWVNPYPGCLSPLLHLLCPAQSSCRSEAGRGTPAVPEPRTKVAEDSLSCPAGEMSFPTRDSD